LRKGCLVLAIVLAIPILAALWLVSGILGTPRLVTLDPGDERGRMLALAPDGTDVFILPEFGRLQNAIRRNPFSRQLLARETEARNLRMAGVLLGGSDVVVWRENQSIVFATNARGGRRWLLQTSSRFGLVPAMREEGEFLVSGPGGTSGAGPVSQPGPPLEGHFFIVHRVTGEEEEERYPPLPRPAISAVTVEKRRFSVVSQAEALEAASLPALPATMQLPSDAMLSIAFWQPNEAVRELDRFLPLNLYRLSSNGALLSIYELRRGKLLPRPEGFIALPENEETREAVGSLFNVSSFDELLGGGGPVESRQVAGTRVDRARRLGSTVEAARFDDSILVGFDDSSLERFLSGAREEVQLRPGTLWQIRGDPRLLVPELRRIEGDRAIRFVAPRVIRSVRQLLGVLQYAERAHTMEAVRLREGRIERLELSVEH
jgi:hypothetical protein